MSKEDKTQSFLKEALNQFAAGLADSGIDLAELGTFQDLAVKYLKESFKNGVKAGYRKAYQEKRKPAEAEGQHPAM